METHRAFLALDLSQEARDRIMELEKRVGSTGADVKLVEMENLHVTMKFLGEIGGEKLEAVHDVMKQVKGNPFQLEAKGTGVFPNPQAARVLWVGVGVGGDEVVSIFRQLESGIVEAGFPKEGSFTPHITIGRVKSGRGGGQLIEAMAAFRSTSFGFTQVDRIVLKKSQLTPTGPIYSNLLEVELKP